MKIVIDISEEMYMDCINNVTDEDKCYAYSDYCLRYAIRNGQVLSKGHGDLIDRDKLNLDYEVSMADDWKTAHEIANCVKYAPIVIEADKENDNDL